MVSQGLSDLALDLVCVGDDSVEAVIEVQPLGRGLGAHARHPGKVVAALADQGGELGIALGRHPVVFLDLLWRRATQLRDSLDRVEHGALIGDGLEGVPVSGADEDLHSLALRRGGRSGQNVVRLVARGRQDLHPHGVQDLLDELNLSDEGLGSLVTGSFVFGVLLGAEGAARQVEGDRDVRGSLVLQQREEHGDEAVDGIGGLTSRRRELVHR